MKWTYWYVVLTFEHLETVQAVVGRQLYRVLLGPPQSRHDALGRPARGMSGHRYPHGQGKHSCDEKELDGY
jgi:hypothetical protein